MTDAIELLSWVGGIALDRIPALVMGTGFILIGAVLADRLLERRVSAGVRLCFYLAVLARVGLPAGWTTPIGLLGRRSAGAVVTGGEVVVGAVTSSPVHAAVTLPVWLGLGYAVVALALLGRWIWLRAHLAAAARHARPAPIEISALAARGPVLVHDTLGPLVVGLLRPRVVLPASLTGAGLDPAALRAILAHESAHVVRRDQLLLSVVQLVCIVAWPVLPVWIAARRLRVLIEMACDETVLAGAERSERQRYGEVLLALAEGRPPVRSHVLAPSFAFELRGRLKALGWRRRWPRAVQAGLVGLVGVGLIACSGAPQGTDDAPTVPASVAKKRRTDPVLTVMKNGDVYLFNKKIGNKVSRENLEAEIRAALDAAKSDTLLLRVDAGVQAGGTFDYMAIGKRAGANHIAILTGDKPSDVIPGGASVEGGLDKNIIRRVIRNHINEVKWCYDQELAKQPDLAGRIAVQFTIAATGQVVASVMQNSTMGNAKVESCVTMSVRRWEFPKPMGGGLVTVTYPFNFTPNAGTTADVSTSDDLKVAPGPGRPSDMGKEINARRAVLQTCYQQGLARNPSLRGMVVFHWTVGEDGAVSNVLVERDQLGDPEAVTCMRTIIASWRMPARTSGGAMEVSYPFMFSAPSASPE